ncbi:MAG: L,D-transpeptidase family protein [Syntrophobacter sp.]
MMPKKVFRPLIVAVALFSIAVFPGLAFSESKEASHDQGHKAVVEKTASTQDTKASSTLWRTHIWDAFPQDWLSSPQGGAISAAYQQNGWKPFFIDAQFELNEAGKLVWGRLGSLEEQAVDPKPYKLDSLAMAAQRLDKTRAVLESAEHGPRDTTADMLSVEPASPTPRESAETRQQAAGQPTHPAQSRERLEKYHQTFKAAAEFDTLLAGAFSRYAREMNPFSSEIQARALSGEIGMKQALKELEPSSSQYHALAASYVRYRGLAAHGQQQPYTGPTSLRHGETGNHVRDLQKRLQQEGVYTGSITGHFDSDTQRAVKDFQVMHHVEPDGVIGQKTKEWLNVPFREKVDMIAYAMRSLRQSPTRAQDRFVRINIPQYLLEYHKEGKVQETHRVVVGRATGKKVKFQGRVVGENQTPVLNSAIEQVILNPRWYVGDRIRIELNSEAKADPEWFTRHGYVQMASLYPWGQPRIFQRPGPNNALGQVKFEFPNIYSVYLHDTPKKALFQRPRRDFSHGCIRVEKALDLALTLLNDDNSSQAQKVKSILSGQNQTFIKLSQPVPIAIEYIPVAANGNGQVVFLGDPYGKLKEDPNRKG